MNITTNTNDSKSSATSRVTVSSNFGVHQQNSNGSNDISIRTLVPNTNSLEPYHKALISKLFFRQIKTYFETPFISFSDLMSTVASYFGLNTGSAEREAEFTAISISVFFPLFLICRASDFLTFPEAPYGSEYSSSSYRSYLFYLSFCRLFCHG